MAEANRYDRSGVDNLTQAVALGDGTAAHNLATLSWHACAGMRADEERGKTLYRQAKSLGAQFAPAEFYRFSHRGCWDGSL
jgi:hypothetical protein